MAENDEKLKEKTLTDIIGEWGRWQRQFYLFWFILDFVGAFNNMGYTFYAFKMDFWCDDVPEDFPNKTEAMKCYRYTNSSEKCAKWRYDDTVIKESIVSAFDLVCDRSYLSSLTQTLFMTGDAVAGAVFAYFSDRYGRRPVIWIGFVIEILACISCGLSTNITQYMISRFFQGIGIGKRYALFSMAIEFTGPKHRSTIILLSGFGWVFGYILLPGVAILLQRFRYIQLLASFALILMMMYFYKFYESPRWQMTHNKFTEAEHTIRKILIVNGKSINGLKEKMNQLKEHIQKNQEKEGKIDNHNLFSLLKLPNMRKYMFIIWYSVPVQAFIYFGISYNIGNFGGNFFINFLLSGLVELPSQLLCIFGLKYFGRKTFTNIFLIIVSVSSLAMIPNISTLRVAFALIGKFGISTSWWGISILQSELFPTVLRSTGNGATTIFGRIGAIVAPFIKDLSENTSDAFVFIIFSSLAMVNMIIIFSLPETKGNELPDTLLESENYGKNIIIEPIKDKNVKSLYINSI